MIIIDKPRFNKKAKHCHLISTLSGEKGIEELINFGKKIRLLNNWLQNQNTNKIHFDLFGSKIDLAITAGAKIVSAKELMTMIKLKQ